MWSRRSLLTSFDEFAFEQGLHQIEMVQSLGFGLEGKTALEFGTGWTPIIPFMFRVAGCQKLILCDLNPYLDIDLLQATRDQIRKRAGLFAAQLDIDASKLEEILPHSVDRDFSGWLAKSGFEYRAPYDVSKTDLPDHSIDLVISRAVLEHIPPEAIIRIFTEMRRIIKPHGIMLHTIDHSDHWQHFDSSISRLNFLKFTPRQWRFINNPIAYQNRLRSCQVAELIEKTAPFKFQLIVSRKPLVVVG